MTVQNNVNLIGRLVKDLDGQYVGTKNNEEMFIGTGTLAIDRPMYKGKDNGADFIRIKLLGNRWENVANYLLKGTQVAVQGSIQTGQYEDNDGVTHYTTDILVDQLQLLASPANDNEETQNTKSTGAKKKFKRASN